MERLEFRMERFEKIACVFVGVPCVAVLLYILPVTNTIGGIFGLSCIVMPIVIVNARLVKGIHESFSKKSKKGI